MLTEEQKIELDNLVASMQANNEVTADIQAAVDAKKAEMLSNEVEEVKTEAVVEDEIAPAMAETVDTELQSVPGLLGSPRLNLGQPVEEQIVEEEEEVDPERPTLAEYEAKNADAWSRLMEIRPDLEIPQAPKQGEPSFQGEISEKANIYDKGFSAGEMKEEEKRKKEFEFNEKYGIDSDDSIANTVTNAIGTLATIDDRMKYLYGTLSGDEKIRAQAGLELDKQDKLRTRPTTGFTDLGKSDNLFDAIANTTAAGINAVTQFGVSIAEASVPVVGPALLAADMIGGSVKSWNDAKAEEQGISTEQLFANGDEEVIAPAIGGFFLYKLEHFGIKGLSSQFRKSVGGITNKSFREVTQTLLAGGREGLTEYAQGLGEIYMNAIAVGKENLVAAGKTWDWMTSKEGVETLLTGSFGGGGLKLASNVRKKALTKIADNRSDLDKEKIKENRKIINSLEDQKYKRGTTDDEIKAINAAIAVYEEEISTAVKNPYAKLKNTTISERNKVFSINETLVKVQKQILKTEKNENFSDKQKAEIIGGLEVQVNALKQEANSIIETADGRTNEEYQKAFDEAKEADKEQFKSTGVETTKAQDKVKKDINKKQDQNPIILFMAPYVEEANEEERNNQPKTSKKALAVQFNKDNTVLRQRRESGEVTEKQYEADRVKLKSEFDNQIEILNKTQETSKEIDDNISKNVSSKNKKSSKETQTSFDENLKDGNITRKDNKNNFTDKAYKAIAKLQEGLLNQVVNSKFSLIPDDLIIGDKKQAKAIYKAQVEGEMFELLRDYNPETGVPVAAWLQQQLPRRANRAFKGVSSDRFYKDMESASVQGMIAEEDSEVSPEQKNINTSEALNIDEGFMDTIRKAAKKALLTTKKKVDELKFKTDIAKSFKDDLYAALKINKGLKNTKNNQGLTNAITQNPKAFYDAVSVESMRMARGKDGINPFEEAGFLKFNIKTNTLDKQPFSEVGLNSFLNYYTDPTLLKAARSDRQMNLIEALATSMAAREAITLLEDDVDFRQRFADQQQEDNFVETANKMLNFPKAFKGFVDTLKKLSSVRSINDVSKIVGLSSVTVNDSNRKTKQEQLLDAIKKYGLTPNVFEAAMPASSGAVRLKIKDNVNTKEYKELISFLNKNNTKYKKGDYFYKLTNDTWVKAVLSKTGKSFIPPTGVTNLVAARYRMYYGVTDPAYQEALSAAKSNLNGREENKPIKVSADFFSKKSQEQSKKNMDVLENVAIQLNDAVANGMPKEVAALIIAQGYQATSGLIKIAAGFKYKSKVFEYGLTSKQKTGNKYREEHNPPASVVGANLIWAISNNKVRDIMPYIRKNYNQTQLSKKDDERLDAAKLDATLPKGSTILDNPIVRMSIAGIDLNSIVNVETGKTLAEENNVESASTVDAIAASNDAAIENNSDQVENLIDRAIAKLTELTGTEGTLQMNFGAVPINVLIGGLRVTKLAYQGGKALSDAISEGYKKVSDYMSAKEWSNFVSNSSQEVRNENNPAQVKLMIMNEAGVAKLQEQVRQGNYNILKEFGVDIDGLTTDEIIEKINILRKAKVVGSNTKAPKKKARVFDFDDTLAKTNSNVLYTLPDGTTGSLDATQFAEQFSELQEAGATFDYSEFSQVKDGSKGPLATLAKRFTESKGDRDVFVLTARPAESAVAIQEFLRSTLGISIPLQNITGLANGKPGAKAMWVAEKVSEGYNDIFFADDVAANVKAVADMLDNLGVTKRVQQAKESGQKNLEDEMDSLIRGKKRSKIGKFLSKINIYIPPGADDFAGLLKYFQAKGKLGDEQMKWFQDNLLTPFAQGISAYTSAKVALADDFTALNKRFKNGRTLGIPSKFRKMLSQEVLGGIYTNEQAVRAYLYDKAGEDLGLNKADTQDLIALVEGNGELKAYADAISKITKLDAGYPPITEQWLGGSIATDMAVVSNKAQRAEFLQEFTNNKEQIFSDQNMKLIKQIYGNDYTDALSNILERMETGQNRKKGKDKEFNSAMNWINQSVGAVMAINMRSAILQQMSIVNYMNWNFNNPIKMGMAMANVPQFMKDYMMILNSDFLKERRGGMAIEVNLADIADSNPGNLFLRLNKKVLELGFKPTQWGDSNAIAFGGATWYRNRYNQLIEQGVSESEANSQAMLEFQEVSETAQQSSRVDKVSRQQASDIGRLILAFANTPLQYARETRKATSDLVNGRGDWKTNASKILYYGVAQNIIFTALQQGLFSLLLSDADDEEYEKTDKKLMYSLNAIADGMLRGMGYAGAVVAALKNLGMEYYDQRQKREKGERVYDGALKLVQKGLSISPPISKKIGDIVEGQKFETWRQYKNDPFYQGFAYANYFSGLTNLPADRVFKKIENLKAASQDSTEAWQSVFLSLGWSPYNVGVSYPPKKAKARRSKNSKSSYKSSSRKSSTKSSLNKGLPNGVLGRANNDGTIELADGLKGKQKREVIAHEKKHIRDMKSGILDYDDNFVYYKGNKHERTDNNKIVYNGKKYLEGSSKLPWEAAANKVEKQTT